MNIVPIVGSDTLMVMAKEKRDQEIVSLLEEWGSSNAGTFSDVLQKALLGAARLQIGEVLQDEGIDAGVNSERISRELALHFGSILPPVRVEAFHRQLQLLVDQVLDEDPKEVTRLLWMWSGDPGEKGQDVEQQLFAAIKMELRMRLNRILRTEQFRRMQYKVSQGDLVSELYLKLKKSGLLQPPENRRQFFGLVDLAVKSVLVDMQRASHRLRRIPSNAQEPLDDIHLDQARPPNQLEILLDAEDGELQVKKRLALEEAIELLPERQKQVFRLRRNGVSIKEAAELLAISPATIKRDWETACEFLRQSLQLLIDARPR
jgi:RNA polymerase sigma factor (sigma-70 family)